MYILFLLLLIIFIYLLVESILNNQRVKRIKNRIYVNGTRGKSSVTRLIAGALREGGIRVIAKTTGSSPRFIFPDGTEVLIRRVGSPNIKEQLRTMKWAVKYHVDTIVIECMALQPYTQWISDKKMVQSTVGVMTNVRADHLDVMGPTVVEVEKALSGTVPMKGTFVTTEPKYIEVFKKVCERQKSTFIPVGREEIATITPEDLSGFAYIEHPENIALALKVAQLYHISRETAMRGMQKATPDIGALRIAKIEISTKSIYFVNGFAVNDPDSYQILWERLESQFKGKVKQKIFVINCREDRPDRSAQLAEFISTVRNLERVIVIGTGSEVFARSTQKYGVRSDMLYMMIHESPDKVFERLLSIIKTSGLIFGIGNIKGDGQRLSEYFANRAV